MTLIQLITYYLLAANAAGLAAMALDKAKARRGAWRIPERTLFLLAFFGGSLGCTLGMFFFRHKTKHLKFRLGLPLILICQILLLRVLLPYVPMPLSL